MTTIAYKEGVIAADTQVTQDDTKYLCGDKIIVISPEIVLAAAGNVNEILRVQKWLETVGTSWYDKLDKKPTIKKGLDAILISEGQVYTIYRDGYPDRLGHPFIACGSGWKFAMAGMHMGLSAQDAVKLASEFDVNTNDKVRWLDVKQLQGQSKTKTRAKRKAPVPKEETGTEPEVS